MKKKVYRFRTRPILGVLRALYESGSRLPALRVGAYTLSYNGSNGRAYVRAGDRALGDLRISGLYRPPDDLTAIELASVRAIVENTLRAIRAVAKIQGEDARCAVCRIPLGKRDHARGIGEKCWEKGHFSKLVRRPKRKP